MQIVIELSEKDLEDIKYNDYIEGTYYTMLDAITNGIPIPKGHGRLGDLDALEVEMINGIHAGNYEEGYEIFAHINNMDDCVDCVKCADTIIEADEVKE